MKKTTIHTAAFTLIETLVAISILTIAVAAPLTLASRTLFAAHYARDQMVASQLAQEGIEWARQRRDAQMITLTRSLSQSRSHWLDLLPIGTSNGAEAWVVYDIADVSRSQACAQLSDDCSALYFVGNLYRAEPFLSSAELSAAQPSRFHRLVYLKKINDNEVLVRVFVKWQTGTFSPRTISAQTILHNWLPHE